MASMPFANRKQLDPGGYSLQQEDENDEMRTVGYGWVESTTQEHWVLITALNTGDDPNDELAVWREPYSYNEKLVVVPDTGASYEDVDDFRDTHETPFPGRREYRLHEITIE